MKVRIDEAACEGHGRCFAIAPALFELDELGTSSLIGDGSVSPADEELVRLAAANCPEFAIGISGGVTGARSPRPSISATTSNRISHPRFAKEAMTAFETPLTILGPFRRPVQLLAEKSMNGRASVHDDDAAAALGLLGAPIEGPTHFSQFDPLAYAVWGQRWFERGCISSHFRTMPSTGPSQPPSRPRSPTGARS